MAVITKDATIGEILDLDESTSQFFMEMGMFCFGCPAAREETLEEACVVHAVDVEEMVQAINEHLTAKKQ